jgi:cation-transporting ATPase E
VDARDLPEDPASFADEVEAGTVFGRVTPHQKQLMVKGLQSRGHVVAMTGDGVNDVLALKDSDIGIAIGSGSPASRSVAQLVLIDGSFATLPSVVGEGRRVIGNIERVANLFVTKTIYAIFIALAIGLAGRQFPFLPRHLTLVGSITIGIPAFFLALAPNAERARPGFLPRVLRFAIPIGLAAGLATFFAYELSLSEEVTLPQARTVATLVLAAIGLFAIGIVARPLVTWKKWLIGIMALFLLIVLATPATQSFFDLAPPRPAILLAAVGIVAITGAIIIGSLRAVGWIRQVPEILREGPPDAGKWWRRIRREAKSLLNHHPPSLDGEAFVEPAESDPAREPDPVPGPEIDWFDPDLDPVDAINEPPGESSQ